MDLILSNRKLDTEIFFGLTSPIGTDLNSVITILTNGLQKFNYCANKIHAISSVKDYPGFKKYFKYSGPKGALKKIEAGNGFRKLHNRNDIFSILSISEIRDKRQEINRQKGISEDELDTSLPRTAFIIKSFKKPEEIDLLRKIYGKSFYLISVYSNVNNRENYLNAKFANEGGKFPTIKFNSNIQTLLEIDNKEKDIYGQNISQTFPLGDLFVNIDNPELTEFHINRFLDLIFGIQDHTPLNSEYCMFLAKAASFKSGSLARQVGAALVNEKGEIISLGFNEVPKSGGGQYSPEDNPDFRDIKKACDISDQLRRSTLMDLIDKLQENNLLSKNGKAKSQRKLSSKEINNLVDDCLYMNKTYNLKDAQIMNLIEYNRAVHAELSAIMDAARRGISITNSSLYVTTLPCHECARHIICAGIKEVYYIEPYEKSLTHILHSEDVEVDQIGHSAKKKNPVRFIPFIGIAPRIYSELFQMKERKDKKGDRIINDPKELTPVLAEAFVGYKVNEILILSDPKTVAIINLKDKKNQISTN